MSKEAAPGVDSRGWTGPEPAPAQADRRLARAAFLAAGGPGAAAPQRAASAVSWAGLGVMAGVILLGADRDSWLPGLGPLAMRVRGGVEGWLAGFAGPKTAEGLVVLMGAPGLLAAMLAILGAVAGILSAWRNRAALTRGFGAADALAPGGAFATLRHWEAAPLFLLLAGVKPAGGFWLVVNAVLLWLIARFAAGQLTAIAERRAAGLAMRGASPSGWDLATILVSLAGMILLLAHALQVIG
ncbi:hypothetical protein [Roseomonas sp. WA12]